MSAASHSPLVLVQAFGSALDGKLSSSTLAPFATTSGPTVLQTSTATSTNLNHPLTMTTSTGSGAINAIETTVTGYEHWIGNHEKESFIIFLVMAAVIVIFTGILVALVIGRCNSRRKSRKTRDVETDVRPLLTTSESTNTVLPTFTPYQPYQPYDQTHHGY